MPHMGLEVPRDTSDIRNYSCPHRAPVCPRLCQGCADERGMPRYNTKTTAMCHPRYSLKEEQQVWRVPAEIGRQVLGGEQPGQAGQLGREWMVMAMPRWEEPLWLGTSRLPVPRWAPWGFQSRFLPTWALLSSAVLFCRPWATVRMSAAGRSPAGMHWKPSRTAAERLC